MGKNKIAVLGRGKSLRKFPKFSHLFNTLYIIGTFHKEVRKIGIKHFKGKKIVHLVGRSDWGWRGGVDKDLSITRVQTMYYSNQLEDKKGRKRLLERFKNFKIGFLPKHMKNRGFPIVSRKLLEKYSRKYTDFKELNIFLESNFKDEIEKNIISNKRSRYWPTTGAFAIDICLVENDPEDLHIFGIDACYEPSFVKYNWEKEKYNWEVMKPGRPFGMKEKLIIYYIEKLVKEFPETKFYSASSVIKLDCPNWNLI